MSLWNPRKPLTQPPGYGRVGYQSTPEPKADASKQIVQAAQFERLAATRKLGQRAVVR